MPHGISSCKEIAYKYVEKASNNVSLPPNTANGEVCLNYYVMPPRDLL
jgi:hypothetical protein